MLMPFIHSVDNDMHIAFVFYFILFSLEIINQHIIKQYHLLVEHCVQPEQKRV